MGLSVFIQDNSKELLEELRHKIPTALEEVGMAAEGYVKRLTPVGTPESTGIPGYQGGTLRNSITHTTDDDSAYVGTDVEYAPYQELGTSRMQAANGGEGYIRPAIQKNLSKYKAIIERNLMS